MIRKTVKVLWRDIAGITTDDHAGSWMSIDYIRPEAQKLYQKEYTTVGTIIDETKTYIVIAGTWDDDDTYAEVSMIPRSVIISISPLK